MELISLERLDREIDELDDFDAMDGGDSAAALLDELAQLNLDTLTRRDVRRLTERLRDHPAVWAMLDEWNVGNDDAAEKALEGMADEWHVTVPGPSRKPASVHLEAIGSHIGECAWPGCSLPRKQRQGPTTGRQPRHCLVHTFQYKRKCDRERLRIKRSGTAKLSECCQEWVRSGHRGLCQQHRDYEAASAPPYPLTAVEAAYLGAGGFHLILSRNCRCQGGIGEESITLSGAAIGAAPSPRPGFLVSFPRPGERQGRAAIVPISGLQISLGALLTSPG